MDGMIWYLSIMISVLQEFILHRWYMQDISGLKRHDFYRILFSYQRNGFSFDLREVSKVEIWIGKLCLRCIEPEKVNGVPHLSYDFGCPSSSWTIPYQFTYFTHSIREYPRIVTSQKSHNQQHLLNIWTWFNFICFRPK